MSTSTPTKINKIINACQTILHPRSDAEWEAACKDSEDQCRTAEERLKAERKAAAIQIKRLENIRYLRLEDQENGRSRRADDLYQTINKTQTPPRDATETVIGVLEQYWKMEQKYNDLMIERDNLVTARAIDVSRLEAEKKELDLKLDRAASNFLQEERNWKDERSKFELRIPSHKAELESLRREHDNQVESLQAAAEVKEKQHALSKQKMENKHDEEMLEWKNRFVDLEKATKKKEVELKDHYAAQERMLKEKYSIQESNLKKEQKLREHRLKSDITSLNRTLMARASFEPPANDVLMAPFRDFLVDMGQLVPILSKLWIPQQEGWTDELLARLAPRNQQLSIRRQVIQDSVWRILNENIFCSPFRVFGEEGKMLEVEWKQSFPEKFQEEDLYSWPAPSMDSERWRYDTMKPLQNAKSNPASRHDARAAVKQGFEQSLRKTQDEVLSLLHRVAKLDPAAFTKWNKMIEKAANVWIAMGTQRCRLRVVVPGGGLAEQMDRVRNLKQGGLELIIKPELRRYGDSRGQDLRKDPETMIEGELKWVPDAS